MAQYSDRNAEQRFHSSGPWNLQSEGQSQLQITCWTAYSTVRAPNKRNAVEAGYSIRISQEIDDGIDVMRQACWALAAAQYWAPSCEHGTCDVASVYCRCLMTDRALSWHCSQRYKGAAWICDPRTGLP